MPTYSAVTRMQALAKPMPLPRGDEAMVWVPVVRCDECLALMVLSDTDAHDRWHEKLDQALAVLPGVGTVG